MPLSKEPKKLTLEEICQLEFHPLANLFPLLEGKELDELANDIDRNGLQETIILFQGKILDGRNRYNACRKLGLGTEEKRLWYPFVHFEDRPYPEGVTWPQAATALVITKNIMRRNLTPDQRAMIAAELYAKLPRRQHGGDRKSNSLASELEKLPTADSQKVAVASQLGVSVKHVERAATLQKKDVSKAQQVQAGPRRWRRPSKN
jgi:ParB-like chromosome segregation protein Spo0J